MQPSTPEAFAAARWYGAARVRAVTVVTLAGGSASTVLAPTTALLLSHFRWRTTVLPQAALLLVVVAPWHRPACETPARRTRLRPTPAP